jgi:hypothetical protein
MNWRHKYGRNNMERRKRIGGRIVIIIELPLLNGDLATFYLTPPFVIHQGINKKTRWGNGSYHRETSILVNTIHNDGWKIDLPLKVLKEKLEGIIHE